MRHKRIYTWLAAIFLIISNVAAQTNLPILKGKVIDRGGETIIGAHVRWTNDPATTVTDLDGNFTIPEKGNELVVSFLGYRTKTVKIKPGQKNIVITLEDDAQELDELVVVG